MTKTKIQWATDTWNPIRGTTGKWHCTKISPGCKNCYAEKMNVRFGGKPYVHGADSLRLDEKILNQPFGWRKPRRVFVCSMTDLFHEQVPDEMLDLIFAVMARARLHTFMVLTKRSGRMRDYFARESFHGKKTGQLWRITVGGYGAFLFRGTEREAEEMRAHKANWEGGVGRKFKLPPDNVWLGVSAENQAMADARIPDLLATPAAVRFVSAEPLLGPISFRWAPYAHKAKGISYREYLQAHGQISHLESLRGLDWIIAGGESGPGASPCDVEWIRSIVHQTREAGVACFVKQLGSNPAPLNIEAGSVKERLWIRDSKGGNPDEWPEDLRVREWPQAGDCNSGETNGAE